MDLFTQQEKQAMIQLISTCRFTPDEWESVFKPIAIKLQMKEPQEPEK